MFRRTRRKQGRRAERDAFERPIPVNVRVTFRRDVLAEALWEYGEDQLAEAALGLSEGDLHEVQLVTVWHRENDPDPVTGPKLTNARIMARAMIEYVEGEGRDTKRVRRRTRPPHQAYTGAYLASLELGEPLSSTPAENGLDLHA